MVTRPGTAAPLSPELLYLLHGDPAELAQACAGLRAVDIAEALIHLNPDASARVLAALPFDLAVQVFDMPELERHRYEIVRRIDDGIVGPLVEAMSADQQADFVHEMPDHQRGRLLKLLDRQTQKALRLLLRYPPDTAGGIMTTEFVSMPSGWTVDQALGYIREVGRTMETVYAIHVLEPTGQRLVHAVSLRELITADGQLPVLQVGDLRTPIFVSPMTDREEVARIISKYNLLAVPVIEAEGRVIGIVTVDDVIDAMVREQTEDVQKFGGMEALDEPYTEIGFAAMIRKRAGWLTALFLGEMLTATAMGHYEEEIARAVVLALFVP